MTSESYTVVIRGNNTTNRVSGNITDAVYRVDWVSILPQKYNKFQLKTVFCAVSANPSVATDETILYAESSAFPRPGFYDTAVRTRGNTIAVTRFEGFSAIYLPLELPPITVCYPTDNLFNIRLTTTTNNVYATSKIGDWTLTLNFVPVLD